jgi:phage shock protein PspC (stress-responsive transcriptional regulator)
MTTDPHQPPAGTPGGTGAPAQEPPAPGQTPPPRPAPGLAFFNRIRALGLVRRDEHKLIAGVCTGISERYGVDVLLVRGIFVVLAVIGGFGAGLYGLAWLLLPHPDGRIHAEGALHGVFTAGFVGSVLLVLSDLGNGIGRTWSPFWGNGWGGGWGGPRPIVGWVVLGLLVWGVVTLTNRRRGPQPPSGWGPAGSGPAGTTPPGGPAYGTPPTSGPTTGATYGVYGSPADPSAPSGPSSPSGTSSPSGPSGAGFAATSPYASAPAFGTGYPPPYGAGYPGTPTSASGSGAATVTYPRTPAGVVPSPRFDLHAPSHALTRGVLGLALVGAAATVLWAHLVNPLAAPTGLVALGVALGVVALGVILAGLLGRRAGGLAPIAVLLALLSIGGAVGNGVHTHFGHATTWRPVSAGSAASGFTLGVGDATVDLTDPALVSGRSTADPVDIPVQVGLGRARIVVPAGTAVEVDASIGAGDIADRVNGGAASSGNTGGAGVKRVVHVNGDTPVILVRANVGLGSIEVVSQGQAVTS